MNSENHVNDKEIIYSVLERYIYNLLRNSFLAPFSDMIWTQVKNFIDPYISAFMCEDRLDSKQLVGFVSSELSDRIAKFKDEYNKQQQNDQSGRPMVS